MKLDGGKEREGDGDVFPAKIWSLASGFEIAGNHVICQVWLSALRSSRFEAQQKRSKLKAQLPAPSRIQRILPASFPTIIVMADVRSLLKNERASRRIQHKHASYSTTGTLLCTVCHLQLKSETLWEGHLRSAGHLMRLQKIQEQESKPSPSANTEPPPIRSKKRKASDEEEEEEEGTIRKRSKASNGLPEGFFDGGPEENDSAAFPAEMQIPSRPATPLKPPEAMMIPQPEGQVDEDEWAAFESDIATAEAQVQAANDAVISAPAMSAAELTKKSAEEDYAQKKERQEAELEGDKEDAARKLEEDLEEMESLEARVRRLREKREELRRRGSNVSSGRQTAQATVADTLEEEDDDEEDDEWDGWMKG
jgi:hypothetical protein